jgi:hypothetical protein
MPFDIQNPLIFVRLILVAGVVLLLLPHLNIIMTSKTAAAQQLPDRIEGRLAELVRTTQQLPDRMLEQLPELKVMTFITYKMSPPKAQH